MNAKRKLGAALGLAARHRQYLIDAQVPELARQLDGVRAAQGLAERERIAADDAARAQREALAQPSIGADALRRHVAYGHHARARMHRADAAALEASEQAEALRAGMRTLLFERDACDERRVQVQAEQRAEAARRSGRQIDETWLLGRRTTRRESDHED